MFFIEDFIEKICSIIAGFIIVFIIALCVIVMLALPFGVFAIFGAVDYFLDKSECNVFVNNSQVYSGACHFVSVSSVGENGNSKKVTIYKDICNLRPLKFYISENVEVRNAE